MSEGKDQHHRITLQPDGTSFRVREGEAILDAALHAGLNLPHSCKGGSCAACRGKILSGSFSYPFGRPRGITAQEEAQGFALLCEARATSDLTVQIREVRVADDVQIKDLPCRIARKQLLAPDVLAVFLQLPAVETFNFRAGQYLDIMLSGERRRSFSIASPPHDSRLLELHVRRAPGGEFSQRVFENLEEKSVLKIEGPLGQFYYRDAPAAASAGTPASSGASAEQGVALLIGGGTGFAPLKSIIRHVLENGLPRPLHLYWGARTAADLYEDGLVRGWAERYANFKYTPVLSEAGADSGWGGRTGFVHRAALDDYPDLGEVEVYASGPPALIDALKREGPAQGLDADRLYFDSFEYAPDTLEKLRRT